MVTWASYYRVRLSHLSQESIAEAVYIIGFHLGITSWSYTGRILDNI